MAVCFITIAKCRRKFTSFHIFQLILKTALSDQWAIPAEPMHKNFQFTSQRTEETNFMKNNTLHPRIPNIYLYNPQKNPKEKDESQHIRVPTLAFDLLNHT